MSIHGSEFPGIRDSLVSAGIRDSLGSAGIKGFLGSIQWMFVGQLLVQLTLEGPHWKRKFSKWEIYVASAD